MKSILLLNIVFVTVSALLDYLYVDYYAQRHKYKRHCWRFLEITFVNFVWNLSNELMGRWENTKKRDIFVCKDKKKIYLLLI